MSTCEEEYEALIQFLYLAPVGLVQAATDGEIAMINPISAQLLMPISRDGDLTNLFTALETVAPELRHLCANFSKPYGMVCDALRIQINAGMSGKSDPQILALTVLKLDDMRLMAVLNDVSLQVKRERQLKQNEAWFNAILTGITDYALVRLDQGGLIEDWNESIGRVTGFARDEVLGRPYSIFYPPDATTPDRLTDRLRDTDENGWSIDEGPRLKADGSQFWASTMITPLNERKDSAAADPADGDDFEEPSYCLVIRDISDRREASEQHRIATSCDFLTGIANRRTFFEAAEIELERMKRSPRVMSLILFDADHFKKINDRYGHPAGDAVLRHFAAALTATFRQVDVVARVGGEEFAVMLPSTDLESAYAVAERLRRLVESQWVEFDGVEISYTVSGGVAVMSEKSIGLDALMKSADVALYAAKARGRNCIERSVPALAVSAITDQEQF
jgi:diguanylate cyclase (GGDEF)-like protein/PAS domain S-box-containing protein